MSEHWKPVVGYEGIYEVSDMGRVRRVSAGQGAQAGLILKPTPSSTGHLRVSLYAGGSKAIRYVHRLVLEAFVGPCPPGMEACHWDDDPTNNSLENLRWDSRSANVLDQVRNGIHSEAGKTHCKYGHEYTHENTYLQKSGYRTCRECQRQRHREQRARRTPAAREAV